MEVKAEEEVSALKGDDFVLFVYMKELDVVFEELGFLDGMEHCLIEVAELMKFKVGIVA